jgi:hypothetical protein
MYILISLSPLPHLSPSPNLSISLHICIFLTISIYLSVAANVKKIQCGKRHRIIWACSLLLKRSPIFANAERKWKNVFYTKIARSNDKETSISMVRDQYRTFATFPTPLGSYCLLSNRSHLMRFEYHVLYATMHVQY